MSNVNGNVDQDLDGSGVRQVELNLPEDEGEGLGFRLTRTLWDPYPWIREVSPGSRAEDAGLRAGDCLLQAEGTDLLGMPIGQVAGLIRGDGFGQKISLVVWNCGVDPKDDPELLWSCGGASRGERSRRALEGVVRALSCCVCAATATRALSCHRSHLYCEGCWSRLERCALCRETLPAKDSPYARNLVAEQVFEAIAKEYEIKNGVKKHLETSSAHTSPSRSPNRSPAASRRGQYQISMMSRKKVQFIDKHQNYASDPNLHRPSNATYSTKTVENSEKGIPKRICPDENKTDRDTQTLGVCNLNTNCSSSCQNLLLQHRLVTRLRQASSLADLQKTVNDNNYALSQSLHNLGQSNHHSGSVDSLKSETVCDNQVIVSGRVLNVVFDPPRLMKGIQNNFLTKDMLFCSKVTKWQDIIEAYKTDCELCTILASLKAKQ